MQFNSFIFILVFLPVTVLLYHLANRIFLRTATCGSEPARVEAYANTVRTQRKGMIPGKIILLLAGIIFYAYSDWTLLIIMGISLAVNYQKCTTDNKVIFKLSSHSSVYLQ